MKKNLLDFRARELNMFMKDHGVAAYRGTQIRRWLYQGAETFGEMSDLPADLREWLDTYCSTGALKISRLLKSGDGTCKFLFELEDGNLIESVLMKYSYGYSACISSQAGCRMGCKFCASTGAGFVRNLSTGEMLGQIITMNREQGIRIGHVVIMGVGEPLDNYDNVVTFLREAQAEDGLGIGFRHLALSTCGLVPNIYKLAEEQLPLTLAISLHAPNDELRSSLMPINKAYPLAELMEACKAYIASGGRRITFEYAMIAGVNDSKEHAEELCRLIKGIQCHVNLIPMNDIPDSPFGRSTEEDMDVFKWILTKKGVEVTVRRELGRDINAACGQLRRKEAEGES